AGLAITQGSEGGDPIDRPLHDYIGLYARDKLDQWRTLFHPGFVAAFTNDDGTTTSRTLDQFLERQRNYFATGRPISEVLEDVKVERQGPLATVRAGFVLHDGPTAKKGRLMMLLIRGRDRFLIQSLVFTYHLDGD
ncbi:MAG TPA: nuclear transport factor 2 family protein, partial [Candidatus Polarisedimenticolia bacterium]|nr:nuclear transport factor 2 family protein [Candidatus Polarisedimenticolia bacterium]